MSKKPLCNNARRLWCIDTSVANIAEGNSCPITGHVLRKAPISPKTSLLRTHPARGGRRGFQDSIRHRLVVSTLALRAEDAMNAALPSWSACNFYPHPPYGGRPARRWPGRSCARFLSSPSIRRATVLVATMPMRVLFLSSPSIRRATCRTGSASMALAFRFYPALHTEGDIFCRLQVDF